MANIVDRADLANTPSIITSAGTVLTANTSRRGWSIQNCGQNPLFVRLGASASTTVFHVVLAACASANDNGTGGIVTQTSGVVYAGDISIAGTSPRCVVMEL